MKKFFLLFVFSLIWAKGSVNVFVDSKNIVEGGSVILTVKSENSDSAPQVNLPKMADFQAVSGPSQSTSTSYQYINGKMTGGTTYTLTWTLVPKRTGKLVIPSFKISLDGNQTKSNPIYVNVSKVSKTSNQNRKFYIEANVDKTDPFRGEQVIITYVLYTKVDITGFDNEVPSFKGFWSEEIYKPTNLKLQEVVKNGERYHMAIIEKRAIFPTKSGTITIDPMVAVVGVREKRRNDFSIFGPPSKNHTISTNAITLNVQPLPKNNSGKMTPVIGAWNISSSVNTKSVKENEAITYTIKINGTGNVKAVDIEPIEFPGELEVFDPEVTLNKTSQGGKIVGDKTIEYVLIPRYSGEIVLPEITFTFFNSMTEKWVTQKTKPISLQVSPSNQKNELTLGFSKEEVSLIAEDIKFNDESSPRWREKDASILNKKSIMFLVLSILLLSLPTIFRMRETQFIATANVRHIKKQYENSVKLLAITHESAEKNYSHIHKVLIWLINLKLKSTKVEYSTKEIMQYLTPNIQNNTDKILLREVLDRGDAVRFSPISSEKMKSDIDTIKRIIKEVNRVWK